MRGNPQTHPQAGKVDGMDRATRKFIISAPETRVSGVLIFWGLFSARENRKLRRATLL